jgi:hypothetical protein
MTNGHQIVPDIRSGSLGHPTGAAPRQPTRPAIRLPVAGRPTTVAAIAATSGLPAADLFADPVER